MSNPLLDKAAQHTARARAIHDEFRGKEMPQVAADQMEGHLQKASEYRKRVDREEGLTSMEDYLSAPQHKHDMHGDSGKSYTGDGMAVYGDTSPQDRERLTKDQSVKSWVIEHGAADLDVDAAWDAFAAGVVGNDWQKWMKDFASKTMGTGEPGGGYLVPDVLSGDVIDRMRASTPIFAAGASTVPMTATTHDIARITGDPSASWHAESAAITASDATLDRVRFTARTLPALVKVSRELAEDAPNVGKVVRQGIAGAIGAELTRVALRGSGVAPEPLGIRNQTGVELFAFGANGGPLTIDALIDRVIAIRTANAEPTGIVWHPRTSGGMTKLAKTTDGAYFPLPSPLAELGKFTSTTVPANLAKGTGTNLAEVYFGDWPQLLIGLRSSLRIEPLRERFADDGDIGFLAWMRADVQLEHGAAFSVISDTST